MITPSVHLYVRCSHIYLIPFTGTMNLINWPAPNEWVFIAQLVEHCSANAEAMGSQLRWPNFPFICMSTLHMIFIRGYLVVCYRALYLTNVSYISPSMTLIFTFGANILLIFCAKKLLNFTKNETLFCLFWTLLFFSQVNYNEKVDVCNDWVEGTSDLNQGQGLRFGPIIAPFPCIINGYRQNAAGVNRLDQRFVT